VVREGVGAGGRNEPSLVCTYDMNNKRKMKKKVLETKKKERKDRRIVLHKTKKLLYNKRNGL
jgi:hypothetical protein